jgi:hypothetical protein
MDPFLEIETTVASTRLKTYAESRGRPTSISFLIPESYLNSVRAGTSRVIVRSFEVRAIMGEREREEGETGRLIGKLGP